MNKEDLINQSEKPNIIVILSDDQGYWALGCSGNEDVKTPNIDALAEKGLYFENFFCTSPVCSPARASLLTGKIPSQHGIHDWLRHDTEEQKSIDYLEGQQSYSKILKKHGYSCGISGKWHLGNSAIAQHGFDHWYVHAYGGGPYYGAPMYKNGELISEEKYITEAITDDAIQFVKGTIKKDKPFCLSINYTAPHSPWIDQHPKKYLDIYNKPLTSCEKKEKHPWSTTNYDENHYENLKGYYASITAMDDYIGKLIEELKKLNVYDNTIIWFLSDNGFNFGHHGIWGKGNGTYPLNLFDTSIKVPAIVSYPRRMREGKKIDDMLSAYDFLPTLLDYLGLESEIPEGLPGKSFAHLLNDENQKHTEKNNTHIVIYDEYGPTRMIRTNKDKYIHRYPYGPHEYYDLQRDPNEEENLIKDTKYQTRIKKLRKELEIWFKQHSKKDVDGIFENVKGAGQYDKVGKYREGSESFYGFDNWAE